MFIQLEYIIYKLKQLLGIIKYYPRVVLTESDHSMVTGDTASCSYILTSEAGPTEMVIKTPEELEAIYGKPSPAMDYEVVMNNDAPSGNKRLYVERTKE